MQNLVNLVVIVLVLIAVAAVSCEFFGLHRLYKNKVYFRVDLEGRLQYSVDKEHWNHICKYVKDAYYKVPVNGQSKGPAYVYLTNEFEIKKYKNEYNTLDKVHIDQRLQLKLYKDALYVLLGIDN